ncbi:MAG: dihydroneopterin aldolase [Phenylobacterium sp.]|jgi:dihydroneopterin aldolase
MDIVFIQQLAVNTTIGVYEWEKKIKQKLLFDLEIASDVGVAAATDNIDDAIDYAVVSDTITRYVEQNQFELIETVAEAVANIILTDFAANWVSLTIQKPGAVENALTVGVKITRQKTA